MSLWVRTSSLIISIQALASIACSFFLFTYPGPVTWVLLLAILAIQLTLPFYLYSISTTHSRLDYMFLACLVLGSISYILSLSQVKGDFMKSISYFSYTLLSSVFLFFISINLAIYSKNPQLRLSSLLLLSAVLLFLFTFDTGNSLESHGAYNTLVFLLLLSVWLLLVWSLRLSYWLLGWNRFIIAGSSILVLSALVFNIQSRYYQQEWLKGLGGHSMDLSPPYCLYPAHVPFPDFPPDGFYNFWAGRWNCPTHSNDWTASIEGTTLEIDCSIEASYTLLNDTRGLSFEHKTKLELGKSVYSSLQQLPYSSPVPISQSTIAVVAYCGTEGKLLVAPLLAVQKPVISEVRPNVLVLMFDGLSRRHFYRKLRKSVEVLNRRNHSNSDSQMYQFFRYSSVGFNTNPNTRALYTGDKAFNSSLPVIWEDFYQAGYVTSYSSNGCEDWSSSFEEKITSQSIDHEMISPSCLPGVYPSSDPHGNFDGPYSIRKRCIFDRFSAEFLFQHQEMLADTYPTTPWMSIMTFLESHEGTGEVITSIDELLAEFLETIDYSNTAVFLMADHGLHMGLNYALTANGEIERSNPLLVTSFPDTLPVSWKESLALNQQALLTPFDIFHSFKYLVTPETAPSHGTLFTPLPTNRHQTDNHGEFYNTKCFQPTA